MKVDLNQREQKILLRIIGSSNNLKNKILDFDGFGTFTKSELENRGAFFISVVNDMLRIIATKISMKKFDFENMEIIFIGLLLSVYQTLLHDMVGIESEEIVELNQKLLQAFENETNKKLN